MLEDDVGVLRGSLTRSQTMIVSESMPSTRSSPAIRSRGVGGSVFASRSVPTYWLEVTALLSMTRQAAGAMDSAGIEPKQMSTGLARKSAMLSGKMTPFGEATELHEEPWISPYLARQLSDGEIWTAHGGVNPCGLVVRRGGI